MVSHIRFVRGSGLGPASARRNTALSSFLCGGSSRLLARNITARASFTSRTTSPLRPGGSLLGRLGGLVAQSRFARRACGACWPRRSSPITTRSVCVAATTVGARPRASAPTFLPCSDDLRGPRWGPCTSDLARAATQQNGGYPARALASTPRRHRRSSPRAARGGGALHDPASCLGYPPTTQLGIPAELCAGLRPPAHPPARFQTRHRAPLHHGRPTLPRIHSIWCPTVGRLQPVGACCRSAQQVPS